MSNLHGEHHTPSDFQRHTPQHETTAHRVISPTEAPMVTKSRTSSRASRTRATNATRPTVTEPVADFYRGKVTVARTRVDVPMLVLRGEWLKAIGFRSALQRFCPPTSTATSRSRA
jgi:hypothetical protein